MSTNASKIAQSIALTVKSRRKLLGLTQEQLADLAGIDRTYASQIERAIANPSLSVLCSVAKVLEMELVELVSLSNVERQANT